MERVVILGPAGSGKTRLARELSSRTGLPAVHLDVLFWREEWAPAPRDEARRDLTAAAARERWIIEGNFLPDDEAEPDPRFQRADTVIFLDLPRRTCIRRVLMRLVRDRGRSRADLPRGAYEGFDLPLLRWIWTYETTDRPRVLRLLAELPGGVAVHHLRSTAEVKRLLETM